MGVSYLQTGHGGTLSMQVKMISALWHDQDSCRNTTTTHMHRMNSVSTFGT